MVVQNLEYNLMSDQNYIQEGNHQKAYQKQAKDLLRKQTQQNHILQISEPITESFFQIIPNEALLSSKDFKENYGPMKQEIQERFKVQSLFHSEYIIKCYELSFGKINLRVSHEPYICTLEKHKSLDLSYPLKLMAVETIAKVLQKLKKSGITHNFIHPRSICVCELRKKRVIVKLHNFQYSQIQAKRITLRPQYRSQILLQNPYVAPEVRNKNQSFTDTSDVWSLGAILYQLVFGTLKGIKVTEKSVELKFPQETPEWMKTIFKGFLSFHPNQRYNIGHFVSVIGSAIVCSQTTQKMLEKIKWQKWQKQTN